MRFSSDMVREFQRLQVDILRQLSPGRPITHNFMAGFTFLPEGSLPPAKTADHFGTMSEGLQRPETRHSGKRSRIVWSPVDRTRLLFHDPPAALAAGAIEVMMKGDIIRIAGTQEMFAVRFRKKRKGRQKAQRVRIPTRKI